jgi:hypothetical protein
VLRRDVVTAGSAERVGTGDVEAASGPATGTVEHRQRSPAAGHLPTCGAPSVHVAGNAAKPTTSIGATLVG